MNSCPLPSANSLSSFSSLVIDVRDLNAIDKRVQLEPNLSPNPDNAHARRTVKEQRHMSLSLSLVPGASLGLIPALGPGPGPCPSLSIKKSATVAN